MFMHNYSNDIVDSLILISPEMSVAEGLPKIPELIIRPNPFNSVCRIELTGANVESGELIVFGIDGRPVRRLKPDKSDVIFWDGINDAGKPMPTGVYFISINNDVRRAGRVVLLK